MIITFGMWISFMDQSGSRAAPYHRRQRRLLGSRLRHLRSPKRFDLTAKERPRRGRGEPGRPSFAHCTARTSNCSIVSEAANRWRLGLNHPILEGPMTTVVLLVHLHLLCRRSHCPSISITLRLHTRLGRSPGGSKCSDIGFSKAATTYGWLLVIASDQLVFSVVAAESGKTDPLSRWQSFRRCCWCRSRYRNRRVPGDIMRPY